jgi:hypothetical protein
MDSPAPVLNPDMYVQLPRRALVGLDGGVGMTALTSPAGGAWMPYAQLGWVGGNDAGFYVTEGYIWPGGESANAGYIVGRGQAALSTLAYQWPAGRVLWHVFATVLLRGPYTVPCASGAGTCAGGGRSVATFIGATMEVVPRWARTRDE